MLYFSSNPDMGAYNLRRIWVLAVLISANKSSSEVLLSF